MATEEQGNGSTEETSGQEQQGQQQGTTGETSGNGAQQPVIDDSTQLPDTHPLVKSLGTLRAEIATQKTELTEARAASAKATKLEEELAARPTAEALATLQTRYDRLEAFLQGAGGDLGSALDSRTFTRQLFETDDKIEDIVKAWNKAHPSATSQALASAAAAPGGNGKVDPNALIRAAMPK